jgi:hypothetical protein
MDFRALVSHRVVNDITDILGQPLPTRSTRNGNTNSRPNCTHVTMDINYSPARCDVCSQYPALGWLYECKQDEAQEILLESERQRLIIQPDDPKLVVELKTMGFSQSIISQAIAGVYTPEQIEKLKEQRAKVIGLVAQAKGTCAGVILPNDNLNAAPKGPESPHPNVTVRKRKALKPKKQVGSKTSHGARSKCNLKCCHVSTAAVFSFGG